MLQGLSGPIDGKTYAGGVMAPMAGNRDEWIADVSSFIRSSFGNATPANTPADVARVRAATADRKTFWTVEELTASLPTPLTPGPAWKVTASHNGTLADGALTFKGWSSAAPQQPCMWLLDRRRARQPADRGLPPRLPGRGFARRGVVADAAAGQGAGTSTTVVFEPVRARFLKITQTTAPPEPAVWSMVRLRILQLH